VTGLEYQVDYQRMYKDILQQSSCPGHSTRWCDDMPSLQVHPVVTGSSVEADGFFRACSSALVPPLRHLLRVEGQIAISMVEVDRRRRCTITGRREGKRLATHGLERHIQGLSIRQMLVDEQDDRQLKP
jgi:hypothetical protein